MEMKMTKLLTAIALAIVLPSIAHAQATPDAPAKKACCAKMKAKDKKCCCDDMARGDDGGHAMKRVDRTTK
jgi:hypothetical protein